MFSTIQTVISHNGYRKIFFWIMLLFYTCGAAGLILQTESFAGLSPMVLLLSAILLLIDQRNAFRTASLLFCVSFLIGYLVEFFGVHFQLLFGTYHYGEALGLSLFDIPLIIGVNWFLLTISAGSAALYLFRNPALRIITAALLMVFTDLWIEPLASQLDFWYWQNGEIPLSNYFHWFLISLFLQWLFVWIMPVRTNKLPALFYLMITAFFVVLNIAI